MSRLPSMRAWLGGLALAVACEFAYAQQPAPPQASVANSTGAATTASGLPADIPLRRDTDSPAVQSGQWAFALWGLVVLAAVAWVLARRRPPARAGVGTERMKWMAWIKPAGGSDSTSPKQIGQIRLTPRHSLHTVQWHGEEYLIGCSDHGVQLMAQRPQGESQSDGAHTP